MKFEYVVELESGYKPVMQDTEETEIRFVIEANNRATANRMVRAMFEGSTNIRECSGINVD